MTYTYKAYVQFREPSANKFQNPSPAPTVSAIDTDGGVISGATIVNIATGIYKCELIHANKMDVIFLVSTTDITFPDFALLESERVFDIIDWMSTLPANIWGYVTRTLTQTSTEIAATISEGSISQIRGNTWALSVDLNTDLTGAKLQFSIKRNPDSLDSEAMVFIDTDTGLIYLNGASATAGDGSLVIDDAVSGIVTVNLNAAATAQLREGRFKYGFQAVIGGSVTEVSIGSFRIISDIVRASS